MNIGAVQSIFPAMPGQRVQADEAFAIDKSPLRDDDAGSGKRVAEDSFEFSNHPEWMSISPPYSPPQAMGTSRLYDPAADGDKTGAGDGRANGMPGNDDEPIAGEAEETEGEDAEAGPGDATDAAGQPLDEAQQLEVKELKARDQEVRRHEQTHKAVGGAYAGAISYDYQQGPDGQRYAVGGEVSIDVSEEKDPAATVAKMRQVRAAALAPAEPSGQDRAVAAEASRIEAEARQEMNEERAAQAAGSGRAGETGEGENGEKDENDANERTGGVNRFASGYGLSAFGFGRAPIDIYA